MPERNHHPPPLPPGGGVLSYKRLMGMFRWWGSIFTTGVTIMRSHFQESSVLEWGRKFSDFGGKQGFKNGKTLG